MRSSPELSGETQALTIKSYRAVPILHKDSIKQEAPNLKAELIQDSLKKRTPSSK